MLMLGTLADSMIDAMHAELNTLLGATAKLRGRDGSVPASVADADTGSQICRINLGNPVFNAVSGGTAGLNGSTDDTATAAGTITYWRMYASTGEIVLQWTEGADFVTDDPTFGSGDTCHIIDITLAYTVNPPES